MTRNKNVIECIECGDLYDQGNGYFGSRCAICGKERARRRYRYQLNFRANASEKIWQREQIRNQEIIDSRNSGENLRSIAKRFQISYQRVQQIIQSELESRYYRIRFADDALQLFSFIKDYQELYGGNSPTVREMKYAVSLSTVQVWEVLEVLEWAGKIRLIYRVKFRIFSPTFFIDVIE